ncbi:MAG: M56 family metallopeptidase, partial [Gemmatimonadota bacterium]
MMMTTMMWIALKSTVILTGASLAGVLMRRASASLRHLLWTASLSAVLALPLLEASGFRVEVPVPSGWPGTAAAVIGQPRESEPVNVQPTPPSVAVTASEARPSNASFVDAGAADRSARTRAPGPMPTAAVKAALPAGSDAGHDTAPANPDWSAVVPWIWVFGLALSLVVTVRGHRTAHRITSRHVRPAAPTAQRRLAALLCDTGIRSRVRLVVSRRLDVPATWGLRRHTIVLPERSAGWTSRRLDRVLVHELAHVRRRDCLVQLVGELARALYWPNPLAWIAVHRLRLEGERAADDEVLSRGDVPSAYAGELVELARALRVASRVPQAALAMAAGSGLGGRVRSILDPARPRGRVRPATVTLVGLGGLVLAFSASAITPAALAQERPQPHPQAPVLSVADARAMGQVGFAPPQHESSDPGSPAAPSGPTRGATQGPEITPQQELCVFRPDSERRSTSYHVDDDVQRIRWETDDCSVEIDIDGRIEWAEDDTGITTLPGGAFFQIEERMGRSRTRV